MRLEDVRREYGLGRLSRADLGEDPVAAFERWLQQAFDAGLSEAHAMTVATADADRSPSARTVLLKGVEQGDFVFATNYLSRKGRELEANDRVALLFFWQPLERQVRIEGRARRAEAELSDRIFDARPEDSRIGAWASAQSREIAGRAALDAAYDAAAGRLTTGVPRPEHWGAYRIRPERIEFWQGGARRLHDRIVFEREGEGWTTRRLAP